jgi:hypothetical protein
MKFLGVISKYFNSEWSVSKIKINEDLKTVAFDTKNNRVTVITYNRLIFSFPIPDSIVRYIPQADLRLFQSKYQPISGAEDKKEPNKEEENKNNFARNDSLTGVMQDQIRDDGG